MFSQYSNLLFPRNLHKHKNKHIDSVLTCGWRKKTQTLLTPCSFSRPQSSSARQHPLSSSRKLWPDQLTLYTLFRVKEFQWQWKFHRLMLWPLALSYWTCPYLIMARVAPINSTCSQYIWSLQVQSSRWECTEGISCHLSQLLLEAHTVNSTLPMRTSLNRTKLRGKI